ncbi:Protein CBG16633 [Caenorhabditis briggsae]|uniref:Protein CBG16633 n=2 Tax=Caenorhabditis briggsae TaxID=6238 RepID=A8XP70_CAEBR|nr:Protein CBG16633 [Caenorhabditis briggsae]ULU01257.1 hypothetical protein L3Y34_001543 [Caenorhabditis briggsae]CAP34550.1 Protein CBG16633 [Caenorhabditis briggsae]
MRPLDKKILSNRNEKKDKKGTEEVGIPTVFTPVPSDECSLVEQQFHRNLRDLPQLTSEQSSDVVTTEKTNSVPTELKKVAPENQHQYPPFYTRELTRMALIRVYFMQNLYTSFELSTDRTLLILLRFVIKGISKEIRNKFSFYVFASPYDVIWKRPRCELMKKPPPSSMFRQILTPSQMNRTLGELFKETRTEGLDTMNIYIFIKDMDDTIAADEVSLKHKCWKYQQVVE